MEYGSHVWGDSTHTVLLNRVKSKVFRLINSPPLTDSLDFLGHRCNVASLSPFYRYFHADCSCELANCMPLPFPRPHCTRLSTSSHPYSIHLSDARVNQYLHSFISYTDKLISFVCFSTCQWIELFHKRSVKTLLILKWTSTLCFYFSYCPLYRVRRQAGFLFLMYFCCPLANTLLI